MQTHKQKEKHNKFCDKTKAIAGIQMDREGGRGMGIVRSPWLCLPLLTVSQFSYRTSSPFILRHGGWFKSYVWQDRKRDVHYKPGGGESTWRQIVGHDNPRMSVSEQKKRLG